MSTDRNLLFGILAQQMDFITRDALIAAMHAWVQQKSTPIGKILLDQKALTPDTHALLEAMVTKHLEMHGNDVERSLAAVSSLAGPVRRQFEQIGDADVQASLLHVARDRLPDEPAGATVSFGAGKLSSEGVRFRILRPHAKGGLGMVYVAQDEELHREVALKEIQDRYAGSAESRTRFMVEAEITGGLEHPGIVPVYGLGQYADGRPFYAMRFIRGDSLKDAIKKFHNDPRPLTQKTLELRELLERFIDVCQAMQYAHDRGVLHRDLKPGNIMLGKYGETLVVDWGLAKSMGKPDVPGSSMSADEPELRPYSGSGTETVQGTAIGTPQYMSPEQAAGRLDQLGPASDIYSLGATLFCLLTGKPPIEEAEASDRKPDLAALLKKVQEGDFPRPRQVKPGVHPALEAICLKAMALKPKDRYAAPQDLIGDLKHWLADEPVSAWPDPWTVKVRRWMGRNRTLVTGVAAALLVGLVSLSVATVLLTQANDTIKKEVILKEEQTRIAKKRQQQSMLALGMVTTEIRDLAEEAMVPAERRAMVLAKLIADLQKQVDENAGTDTIDSVRNNSYLYTVLAVAENESALEEDKTTWIHAEKARSWCAKGLEMVDHWLTLAPGDPLALSRRASLLQVNGSTLTHKFAADDKKAKEVHFAQALAIRRKLANDPEAVKIVDQFTPGKAKAELADSLENAGQFEESFGVHDDLCREHPTPAYLDGRAFAFVKAAFVAKNDAERRDYLTKANQQYTELHERFRGKGQFSRQMYVRWAIATRRMFDLESSQNRPAEAQRHLEKYALMAQHLATSGEAPRHHYATGFAHYEIARLQIAAGQEAQARASADAMRLRVELLHADYPKDAGTWNLQVSLCRLQVQMGEPAPAIRGADFLQLKYPDAASDDRLSYRLACVYALCIPAIAKARGKDPLTADDKKQQALCRAKALQWLDNALKHGYRYFDDTRKDPDFEPIRDDPRFEAVLQKYEKK